MEKSFETLGLLTDRSGRSIVCPGDGALISHSIHLGRLAAFYPPCRNCEHRDARLSAGKPSATGSPPPNRAALPDVAQDLFGDEGLLGVVENQIDARVVRSFAAAVGIEARESRRCRERGDATPRLALAADGRSVAADLLAAASEGARHAGCRIVELEPLTAPALATSIVDIGADGGLFIGNSIGAAHTVGVRAWDAEGAPLSAGDRLTRIRRIYQAGAARPVRSGGGVERRAVAAAYLASCEPLFHALRPLRFILDTSSPVFNAWIGRLTSATACRVLVARGPLSEPSSQPNKIAAHPPRHGRPLWANFRERRVRSLAAQTFDDHADFGIWIDGDGERASIVDERGRVVSSERLLLALAPFGVASPAADALLLLGRLLALLSRSDAPLSAVLDHAKFNGVTRPTDSR